jgi:hypothetical protein
VEASKKDPPHSMRRNLDWDMKNIWNV